VAAWNLNTLVRITEKLSPDQRAIVFGQVAWLSESAGRQRLKEVFDQFLAGITIGGGTREIQQVANCLLASLDWLSEDFSHYRIRLVLLHSGAIREFLALEGQIRRLASQSGCDGARSLQGFRSRINQRFCDVLRQYRADIVASTSGSDDGCRPGAVVITVTDRKPDVGVVTEIEQQSYNPLLRCWHKTVSVRFNEGQRRMTLDSEFAQPERPGYEMPSLSVLSQPEILKIVQLLEETGFGTGGDIVSHRGLLHAAS
jgi:hypothetical protein